jgi:nucleoside-diphosphate-sugar epimerase
MNNFKKIRNVLVTGGAGYVGAVLVPKLLSNGYRVRVLDLFIYGENVLDTVRENPNLEIIKGDLRDKNISKRATENCDAIIHLACISNDPSFELDPALGKSINYDAFVQLVELAARDRVARFIYASSSSVYGIKEEENVTEDLPLEPLTDYSKYKVLCEEVLLSPRRDDFCPLVIRPATVCGYSPRLRLDLTVNILTHHAVKNRQIKVFGGVQKRPNIHIDDMTDLYIQSLQWPDDAIRGRIYNVGYENHRVAEIAEKVKSIVGEDVSIVQTPTNDNRSYHISSEKIKNELGFVPKHTIEDAVRDLVTAFSQDKIPDSVNNSLYYNIKRMQELNLK